MQWHTTNSLGYGVQFFISQDAGPGSLYANVEDNGGGWHQFHSTIAPLTNGVFKHVALTYDKASGMGTIYCNGVIVGQQYLGSFTPQTSYDLYMGRQVTDERFAYTGLIDEPTIYNRALSSNEIASIYNAGSAGKCTDTLNHPPVADASATAPLAISINNSNASVTLNGSLSYDLDGDSLQYLWYENGLNIATGVVTVVVLPVGTNSVTLNVNDGSAASQNTIVIEVLTITQAVNRLKDAVRNGAPAKHNLVAILNAALASIDRRHPVAAINQLRAFQHQVNAQIAPVDPTLAQSLVDEAQSIIDALGAFSPHGAVLQTIKPNGKVHLHFSGTAGTTYIIEVSSNLKDWTKIGIATDEGDGTFDFDDVPQQSSRFYRITAQ